MIMNFNYNNPPRRLRRQKVLIMTLQQKKSKKFAEALEELEAFKVEYRYTHPEATEDEYREAVEQKAEELDL